MPQFTFIRYTEAGYVPEPSVGTITAGSPAAAQLMAERKWGEAHPAAPGEHVSLQLLPMPV